MSNQICREILDLAKQFGIEKIQKALDLKEGGYLSLDDTHIALRYENSLCILENSKPPETMIEDLLKMTIEENGKDFQLDPFVQLIAPGYGTITESIMKRQPMPTNPVQAKITVDEKDLADLGEPIPSLLDALFYTDSDPIEKILEKRAIKKDSCSSCNSCPKCKNNCDKKK